MPLVAAIGDRAFVQSGVTRLAGAVHSGARFVLVIFGHADGLSPSVARLSALVRGCGVDFLQEINPCDQASFHTALQQAADFARSDAGGIAVIVANRSCREQTPSTPRGAELASCGKCIEGAGIKRKPASIFELAQQVALEQRGKA